MRILRISPSFASYSNPGSGTNSYFHSKFSKYKSYILTEDRNLNYLEFGKNVDLNQLKHLDLILEKLMIINLFLNYLINLFQQ